MREKPIRVKTVEPLEGYCVRLGFTDGTEKIVDLDKFLWGPIFQPIREDRSLFLQAFVDPETRTLAWPNGADLCPDVLYYGGPPPWAQKHLKKVAR